MRKDTYTPIVQRAMAFMQGRFASPLSMQEVAKAAFCSPTHLVRAFHKITGQSPQASLLQMRLARAKHLLTTTDLTIQEIAENAGLSGPAYFSRFFRKQAGTTPSEYRKRTREALPAESGNARQWQGPEKQEGFVDRFTGNRLGAWWASANGKWVQENGMAVGEAGKEFALRFLNPLPENFEITLEVNFESVGPLQASDFHLILEDDTGKKRYCVFVAGAHDNTTAELRMGKLGNFWSKAGIIQTGKWHRVCAEIKDDAGRFSWDGNDLFVVRDPFPSPYTDRCKFRVGSFRSRIRLRNLVIRDLGFAPLVRIVRQGDSLYTAGIFDRALDFYMRQLGSSGLSLVDAVELRFKIGLCYFRLGDFFQATSWLNKVATLPEGDFWAKQAELTQLRIMGAQKRMKELVELTRKSWPNPDLHGQIRQIMEQTASNWQAQGFHSQSFDILREIAELEEPNTFPYWRAVRSLADAHQRKANLKESIIQFRRLAEALNVSNEIRLMARHNLAFSLALAGQLGQALELTRATQKMATDPRHLARNRAYAAFYLRGMGQYQESINELQQTVKHYASAALESAFAQLQLALMFCTVGDFEQAENAIRVAAELDPGYPMLRVGSCSSYRYPPFLMQGRHKEAAELLVADARHTNRNIADHANQAVKAGILFELAGSNELATEAWREGLRRFPIGQCCFFPELTENLLANKPTDMSQMHFPHWTRSELCYLLGLLWEDRGNKAYSRELLKQCVNDDPTLRWPAWLAKNRLGL